MKNPTRPIYEALGWGLRSDRAYLLRRLVHISDHGGGDFSAKTLAEEYGIYLQDWQIRNFVQEFVQIGYLTVQKDDKGNDLGYVLTHAGREMGLYIEETIQNQRSQEYVYP